MPAFSGVLRTQIALARKYADSLTETLPRVDVERSEANVQGLLPFASENPGLLATLAYAMINLAGLEYARVYYGRLDIDVTNLAGLADYAAMGFSIHLVPVASAILAISLLLWLRLKRTPTFVRGRRLPPRILAALTTPFSAIVIAFGLTIVISRLSGYALGTWEKLSGLSPGETSHVVLAGRDEPLRLKPIGVIGGHAIFRQALFIGDEITGAVSLTTDLGAIRCIASTQEAAKECLASPSSGKGERIIEVPADSERTQTIHIALDADACCEVAAGGGGPPVEVVDAEGLKRLADDLWARKQENEASSPPVEVLDAEAVDALAKQIVSQLPPAPPAPPAIEVLDAEAVETLAQRISEVTEPADPVQVIDAESLAQLAERISESVEPGVEVQFVDTESLGKLMDRIPETIQLVRNDADCPDCGTPPPPRFVPSDPPPDPGRLELAEYAERVLNCTLDPSTEPQAVYFGENEHRRGTAGARTRPARASAARASPSSGCWASPAWTGAPRTTWTCRTCAPPGSPGTSRAAGATVGWTCAPAPSARASSSG